MIVRFFYSNFEYTCIICTCQCSVLFFRHDDKKLAIQARKAREERYDNPTQTKMDRFLGFTDSILVKTKEIYQEMGDEGMVDNAMSIAALDLFSSKSVQENVGLRNDMQKRWALCLLLSVVKISRKFGQLNEKISQYTHHVLIFLLLNFLSFKTITKWQQSQRCNRKITVV